MSVFCFSACAPPGVRACLDGERLTRKGEYAQAIEKLKVATDTDLLRHDSRAWNLLGLAYHHDGQVTNAFAAYQNAVARDSKLASTHYNLGWLYFDQNQFPYAVSEFRTYTRLDPNQHLGWIMLAAAHLRARQFDEAERCYKNAAQLESGSARVLNDLGVVKVQQRRPREAQSYFMASLQKDPAYAPALLNSAIISHHYFTNYTSALGAYRKFLETDPIQPHSEAVKLVVAKLQLALSPPPSPQESNLVAEASAPPVVSNTETNTIVDEPVPESQSRVTNNVSSNLVAVASVPEPAQPEVPHEDTEVKKLEPASNPDVADVTPHATNSPPESVDSPPKPDAEVSSTEIESVTVSEGVRLQMAQNEDTASVPDVENPGILETQTDVPESSDNIAKKPLILPVKPRESKWRIPDRLNPGRWFRAKDSATTEQTEFEPDIPDLEPENDSITEPSQEVESAVPDVPVPPQRVVQTRSYRYRVFAPPVAGDRSQAMDLFSDGLKAHRERRLADAIEAYQNAINADSSFFAAYYNLGLAAYDIKDYAESLSSYEIALSLDPGSFDARYNFALALRHGRFLHDAARELERTLIDHGNVSKVHFTLAKMYADELFETDLARRHYRKVLDLSPRHPQAPAIRYWLAAHP